MPHKAIQNTKQDTYVLLPHQGPFSSFTDALQQAILNKSKRLSLIVRNPNDLEEDSFMAWDLEFQWKKQAYNLSGACRPTVNQLTQLLQQGLLHKPQLWR